MNDKNVFQYVIPDQDDYVLDEGYKPWIFNPQWCVMP